MTAGLPKVRKDACKSSSKGVLASVLASGRRGSDVEEESLTAISRSIDGTFMSH
jgi:hypothetical protein